MKINLNKQEVMAIVKEHYKMLGYEVESLCFHNVLQDTNLEISTKGQTSQPGTIVPGHLVNDFKSFLNSKQQTPRNDSTNIQKESTNREYSR